MTQYLHRDMIKGQANANVTNSIVKTNGIVLIIMETVPIIFENQLVNMVLALPKRGDRIRWILQELDPIVCFSNLPQEK